MYGKPLTVHVSWCWHTTYSTCILVLAHHSQCMHLGAGTPLTVHASWCWHTTHSACILVLAHHFNTVHASWCWHTTYSTYMHPECATNHSHASSQCTHPGARTSLTVNASWCWYECMTNHSQCMHPGAGMNGVKPLTVQAS